MSFTFYINTISLTVIQLTQFIIKLDVKIVFSSGGMSHF